MKDYYEGRGLENVENIPRPLTHFPPLTGRQLTERGCCSRWVRGGEGEAAMLPGWPGLPKRPAPRHSPINQEVIFH